MSEKSVDILEEITSSEYKYGFETLIENDSAPKGLSEEIVRFISAKKKEPEWMLEYRLKAYKHWLKLEQPTWQNVVFPEIKSMWTFSENTPVASVEPDVVDAVDDICEPSCSIEKPAA